MDPVILVVDDVEADRFVPKTRLETCGCGNLRERVDAVAGAAPKADGLTLSALR